MKEANAVTLRQMAALAPGSTLAMTFLLPSELVDDVLRPGLEAAEKGARAAGTPFISFYTPDEPGRRWRFRPDSGRHGTSLPTS